LRWDRAPAVLVVDDHPVVVEVAGLLLKKLGCRMDYVVDGAAAVAAAGLKVYDLIFMDCEMPLVDGFQAAARIRDLPGDKARVPIVGLTAHAAGAEVER